jgi:hypothetical protein
MKEIKSRKYRQNTTCNINKGDDKNTICIGKLETWRSL